MCPKWTCTKGAGESFSSAERPRKPFPIIEGVRGRGPRGMGDGTPPPPPRMVLSCQVKLCTLPAWKLKPIRSVRVRSGQAASVRSWAGRRRHLAVPEAFPRRRPGGGRWYFTKTGRLPCSTTGVLGAIAGGGGGGIKAERVCRLVLPCVHACSPPEEGALHVWMGGWLSTHWVWGEGGGVTA